VSVPKKVLRSLFWAALTVYGVVAIGFLGVRYWVLPRVDQWRPQIEAYASQALGARVTIGAIKANWQGLNPRLDLAAVQVYDDETDPVLSLPSVSAVVAWRSILSLSPTLVRLRLEKPELTLRRDSSNHLWVAGQNIDLNTSDHASDLRGADDKQKHPPTPHPPRLRPEPSRPALAGGAARAAGQRRHAALAGRIAPGA